MATFQAWVKFDLRTLNFGEMIRLSYDSYVNPTPLTVQGRSYRKTYALDMNEDGTKAYEFYSNDLAFSAGSTGFSGGSILGFYSWFKQASNGTWYYDVAFSGFNVSAKKLSDAMASFSPTDDRALIAQMLAGDDVVTLWRSHDWFDGKAGNDTISGNAGNDTLFGNSGHDRISGGDGNDLLQADSGADVVRGGAGADTLAGGVGSDTLAGGSGADVFVLWDGVGSEVITDFQDKTDRVQFMQGPTRFSQLAITDLGSDVRVAHGGEAVILKGIQPGALSAADFIFA